jgi:hypothetical protein
MMFHRSLVLNMLGARLLLFPVNPAWWNVLKESGIPTGSVRIF